MRPHIEEAIERIQQMDVLFDILQQTFHDNPAAFRTDAVCIENLSTLIHYYENGLWLADYELDEQGLLPASLKRGVLSQDGVYNFLADLQEV